MTVSTKRRDELLAQLEAAEREWGQRLEDQLTAEAAFVKTLIERRIGTAAVGARVRDKLAELSVERMDEFLTG